MIAVWASALCLGSGVARGDDGSSNVRCLRASTRVASMVAQRQYVDAHLVAQTIDALCEGMATPTWRLWDAVALTHLEELDRARRLLQSLAESQDQELRRRARVITAWSLLRAGGGTGFRQVAATLEPSTRARLVVLEAIQRGRDVRGLARRLDAELAAVVDRRYADYRARRTKKPWLAATMSATIPGLGQVYAGSLQGAAVAFVINGVLIASTVELARHQLYFASATTGMAASIFYVGNILNAADLARRRNDRASESARHALERALVPEVWPGGE